MTRFRKPCDCRQPEYDEGCDVCVEEKRMAGSCRCTCNEMAFTAVPKLNQVEDCNCTTGFTAPGSILARVFFGWATSDSSTMLNVYERAAILMPGDPRVKFTLYGNGVTGGPDIHCNTGTAGWTPLPINEDGDMELIDPPGGAVVIGDEGPTSGATSLTAEQLGIEIDPVEGGTGTDCAQSGGHRTFKMFISTIDDQVIVECLFGGVTGTPACDTVPCCAWSLIGTSETGCNEDTSIAQLSVTMQLSPDCLCVPDAILRFIVDGVPTDFPLSVSPHTQDFEVSPCVIGQTVEVRLIQTYDSEEPSCATCTDSDEPVHTFTL